MLTRVILLRMADSPTMRRAVETRGWRFASRFVAGRTLDEAIGAVRALNAAGIGATLSHLGEHISDEERAREEAASFVSSLARLHEERLRCGLSIKPSQLGMEIEPRMAQAGILGITEAAARTGQFVRVDMEDSTVTDATLALVRAVHAAYPNIGVVIQSYLRRSAGDVEALNADGISVRLCKGAYNEPPSVAFPTKGEVDDSYRALMRALLFDGIHPAVATHDEAMVQEARRIVANDLPAAGAPVRPNVHLTQWEFQMLYGIRRDLQRDLVADGYRVRVYVPYGAEWYPYFMRRLAERPANVGFLLRQLLKR
ncbi:MAG TPA: proline dehydrogenase family protein [Armatimonadota bacterium]|jgi:proline dehydrogenase